MAPGSASCSSGHVRHTLVSDRCVKMMKGLLGSSDRSRWMVKSSAARSTSVASCVEQAARSRAMWTSQNQSLSVTN